MTTVTMTQTLEDAVQRIVFLEKVLKDATDNCKRWKDSETMKQYYPDECSKAVMLRKWIDDMYGKNTESL